MDDATSSDAALERLRRAVERGTARDLDAWAATGLPGLRLLRDLLTGAIDPDFPDVHTRDEIDNLTAAVAAIAAAHPAGFLHVFRDSAFDTYSYVLTGLGHIDDPRATDRLAGAARSKDKWTRMHAAIGLGRLRSSVAVATLVELLTDPDHLVRYHSLVGLAAVGDGTALPALGDFVAATAAERQLADEAISAITSRGSSPGHPDR
jgi:HEAT repeat protein